MVPGVQWVYGDCPSDLAGWVNPYQADIDGVTPIMAAEEENQAEVLSFFSQGASEREILS